MTLKRLVKLGYNPNLLIDVGCSAGDWYLEVEDLFPLIDYWGFDPNNYQKEREKFMKRRTARWAHNTQSPESHFFHTALGAARDDVSMTFAGRHSSFLQDVDNKKWGKTKKTPLALLDDYEYDGFQQPPTHGWNAYSNILLKIDTQGYEHQVIIGAGTLLATGRVQFIVMEVSLVEFHFGIPQIHETLSFMDDCGFRLYDVVQKHKRPLDGRVGQMDILLVHKESPFALDQRWTNKKGGMP